LEPILPGVFISERGFSLIALLGGLLSWGFMSVSLK